MYPIKREGRKNSAGRGNKYDLETIIAGGLKDGKTFLNK